jgi:D-galactarolactone cycloisomerase
MPKESNSIVRDIGRYRRRSAKCAKRAKEGLEDRGGEGMGAPLPNRRALRISQGWVRERGATIVEIVTDEGVSGWGEALCQGLQPPGVAAGVIQHAFAPLIVDLDPLKPEVVWHRLYNQSRDFGLKGAVIGALSAVDIALWDILGKTLGRPIHALLGGAFRTRVQPYATGFYRIHGRGEAKRLAEEAARHYANGFRIMKIKLGFGVGR